MTKYDYSIPLDNGTLLKIKPTANAWWRQPVKVCKLLAAFSVGLSTSQACERAGITPQNYKYFVKEHPIILEIRKWYDEELLKITQTTVAKGVRSDKRFALRYWIKREPHKFPPPPLLRKLEDLRMDHREAVNELRDDIRELSKIGELYREAYEFMPEGRGKTLAESATKLTKNYNHKHRRGHQMILPGSR